jgi:hypothetical protein
VSLVDEWIANLNRLGVMLDQREQSASTSAQSSAWERDAALQLKAGAR